MAEVSILNDVLGPIMRGPSSSHSAAALRIGRLARDLMGGRIDAVDVDYDPGGSLVTTHATQGSDLGLFGGLLGWQADDPRLPDYRRRMDESGISVRIHYLDYGAEHPNTYRLTLHHAGESRRMLAVSTGGGMIEVRELDGVPIRLSGGSHVLVLELRAGARLPGALAAAAGESGCEVCEGDRRLAILESRAAFSAELLAALAADESVASVRVLAPVLPVLDGGGELPFTSAAGLAAFDPTGTMNLASLGLAYETARSGLSPAAVREHVDEVLAVMEQAVASGSRGTEYADRILPSQVGRLQAARRSGRLVGGEVLHDVIEAVTAVLEVKSSMGTIVAAPTAGSCGVVPGALLGVARTVEPSRDELIDALLAAGLIGMFIARGATFAAEEGGCMAECGSAASMVAAGIATLNGATAAQAIAAASMALQNSFGMTCDTVANRVEAPCLGKNTMAAANAVACADVAVAGYEHLIPLDEVIAAMAEVGEMLPRALCCTGLGGLATTPTSLAIGARLESALAEEGGAVPEPPAPVAQRQSEAQLQPQPQPQPQATSRAEAGS